MKNDGDVPPDNGFRGSRLASATLVMAGILALVAILAGFGSRWGIWHYSTGFTLLRWSVYGGLAIAALAVVAIYRTRPGAEGPRLGGMSLAIIALLLALLVAWVPWQYRRTARGVPPIHDITTDTENPPRFVAVAPLRANDPNPVEYAGEEIATLQRGAYPDIRPVILDLPIDRAFQRALDAVEGQGWTIVDQNLAEGRIEATDRTFWFGFRDDVVIRLTPVEGRTVVDVRSKSRVGRGDMGTNARRIRSYLQAVGG